jgi:hypothetical protein
MKKILLALLFPICALAQFDGTPWQLRVYTNIQDLVLHGNPMSANKVVDVLGFSSANDGGGGRFMATNTVLATNMLRHKAQWSVSSTSSWQRLSQKWEPYTPQMFGAKGDGSQNDTTAFNLMVAAAAADGSRECVIPPGKYGINFKALIDGVNLVGTGTRDIDANTSVVLFPWDTTLPVIQVGDDSGPVRAFSLKNVAILGRRGTTNSPGCIHLLGGSDTADISFVQALGGADTIKAKAGHLFASQKHTFTHCSFWEGTNSTVMVDDTRTGAGYCTGIQIIGSRINGHNTSGDAIVVIRGRLNMDGVYVDGADGGTFRSVSGGSLSVVNCDIENLTGANAILVEVEFPGDTYTERDISPFIDGNGRIQGLVKWTDQTSSVTNAIPADQFGFNHTLNKAALRKPKIALPLTFGTVLNPYDAVVSIDMNGTNGPLTWKWNGNNDFINWFLATNVFWQMRNGDKPSYMLFDAPQSTSYPFEIRIGGVTPGGAALALYSNLTNIQHYFSSSGGYVVASSGNFGVGTQSPARKLDVNGTFRANGLFEVTSTDVLLSSDLNWSTDNTWDIGTAGFHRPRRLYVGAGVQLPEGDVYTLINAKQNADSDLTALSVISTTGIYVRTGSGTSATRTITGSADVPVTNGDGVSGNPTLGVIANNAVTYAKMQDVSAASRLIGRGSASGSGDPEEITLGTGLSLTGTTLSASGEVNTASNLGTGTGVYDSKSGVDLRFRSLVGQNGISVGAASAGDIPISLVATNYVPLELTNPNTAVTTPSTNFVVMPLAGTIKTVTAHLLVASSSGSVTLDLKKNGTSVLSAPVSISAGATNATATVSVTGVSALDRLVGEVTAAGTSAYGAMLNIGFTNP